MSETSSGQRGFRRSLAATVAILVALVAVFGTLTLFQGPKLSDAQIDTEAAIARGGQQLRLFTNQPVSPIEPEQVSIVPDAPFTVSHEDNAISLQFSQPLRYDTEYRVAIAGVSSASGSRASTLTHEFRTGSASVHYLDRGEGGDEIVKTGISTTGREVVYSAKRIQDFAVLDEAIAVVTLDDEGLSLLFLVSRDGLVERVELPARGTVGLLRAERTSGMLGFIFTDTLPALEKNYDRTLFTVDLAGGRQLDVTVGLTGEQLGVLNWTFVPGSTNLVAHNVDQSVLLIDTAVPGQIVPLGQFSTIDELSSDAGLLVVGDAFGALALSMESGETERLDPSLLDGKLTHAGPLELLHDGRRVQQVAILDETTGRFSTHVVFDDRSNARELFRTPRDEGGIEGISVSPNEQFVAVETVPNVATSVQDGYPANARSTSIMTVIIDIETGAVVRSVEGFALNW